MLMACACASSEEGRARLLSAQGTRPQTQSQDDHASDVFLQVSNTALVQTRGRFRALRTCRCVAILHLPIEVCGLGELVIEPFSSVCSVSEPEAPSNAHLLRLIQNTLPVKRCRADMPRRRLTHNEQNANNVRQHPVSVA